MLSQNSFVPDEQQQPGYRLLLDGEWVDGAGPRVTVRDKYRLQPFASITLADAAQVTLAVDAAIMVALFRYVVCREVERDSVTPQS